MHLRHYLSTILILSAFLLLYGCGDALIESALPPTPSPFPTLARQSTVTPAAPTPTPFPTLMPPSDTPTPVPIPDVLEGTALPGANVREGPGEDQRIVYTTFISETVTIHKREQEWYQITLPNGIDGWMADPVLDVSPEIDMALEILAIHPRVPEKFEGTVIYPANVRSGPGEEHGILVLLAQGEKMRVRGKMDDWYRVTLPDSRDGWIVREALDVPPEVENVLPTIEQEAR